MVYISKLSLCNSWTSEVGMQPRERKDPSTMSAAPPTRARQQLPQDRIREERERRRATAGAPSPARAVNNAQPKSQNLLHGREPNAPAGRAHVSGGLSSAARAPLALLNAPLFCAERLLRKLLCSGRLLHKLDTLLDGGAQLGHHGLERVPLVVVHVAQPVDLLHACKRGSGWKLKLGLGGIMALSEAGSLQKGHCPGGNLCWLFVGLAARRESKQEALGELCDAMRALLIPTSALHRMAKPATVRARVHSKRFGAQMPAISTRRDGAAHRSCRA